MSFTNLNQQRLALLIEDYLESKEIETPEGFRISNREAVIFKPDHKKSPVIVLGSSLSSTTPANIIFECLTIFNDQQYFISYNNNCIHVYLKETASANDILQAFFCAYHFKYQLKNQPNTETLEDSLKYTTLHFSKFMNILESKGWKNPSVLAPLPNRLSW